MQEYQHLVNRTNFLRDIGSNSLSFLSLTPFLTSISFLSFKMGFILLTKHLAIFYFICKVNFLFKVFNDLVEDTQGSNFLKRCIQLVSRNHQWLAEKKIIFPDNVFAK